MPESPAPGSLEALADADPAAPALSDTRRALDRRSWDARASQLANALQSELGLAAGERVAVRLGNRVEWFETSFALAKLGASAVPIGTRLTADEVAYIAGDCAARALVSDDAAIAEAAQGFGGPGGLAGVVQVGGEPASGVVNFEELIAAGKPERRLAGPPLGGTNIAYTSGTTGRPKGAVRRFSAEDLGRIGQLVRDLATTLRIGPDEKHLVVAPLYHAAAPAYAQMALAVGGSIHILDRFDAEAVLEAFDRGITSTFLVPTMIQRILALPEEVRSGADLSSLRAVIAGGAPFPSALRAPAQEYLGEFLFDLYGSTETGLATVLEPKDQVRKAGSVGRLLQGVDVRILDADGKPVPDGERGEVFVRSPMQVRGYHGNEAATAESLRDGYFTVGDVGYRDDEGFIYIVDRIKDMIIAGGANIYPAEIEQVLRAHPAVFDAAVFGIPHEDLGEQIQAVVQLVTGVSATPEALIEHCAERLARNKCPRGVEFIDELPRNPTGKVLKRQLREPYWAGRERSI